MQKRSKDNQHVPRVRMRIIIIPLLLLAAAIIYTLTTKYTQKHDEYLSRQSYERIREEIRPHVQRSIHIASVNSNNLQVINELEKRAAHTLPVSKLLKALRNDLPDFIQFNTLSYLSIPILSTEKNPLTFQQEWPISFSIDGIVQSPVPDQVMITYLDSLRSGSLTEKLFTTIQMTRFTPIEQTNIVQFRIEGDGILNAENKHSPF